MTLWTDIIDPATLTGYARASLEQYEISKGTLARWLPNRTVAAIDARFVVGSTGLIQAANFRAYDAEPEVGKAMLGKRVSIELPALGQNIPVTEYQQLITRQASDDSMLVSIQKTTDQVVRAVADRMEAMRGIVIDTGAATISQPNFQTSDSFGRSGSHSVTAGTLWSTAGADRLSDLQAWTDLWRTDNGEEPGSIVCSTRVFRAIASGTQFQTQLLNGGARNATQDEVLQYLAAAGLPPIYRYDRNYNNNGTTTKVLPDNKLYILPTPCAEDDENGTDLGGTFWGQTLTSASGDWGIEPSSQPGVVAGVFRNEKPPVIAEVISDAIGLPVLANANLSLVATVL